MNKLTKLGVSALCGSLAAISAANAGDMTVTGGVDMSWISKDDDTTGNPIGMGSNLTFSGSGEMDNGWNVALSVAMTNNDATGWECQYGRKHNNAICERSQIGSAMIPENELSHPMSTRTYPRTTCEGCGESANFAAI